MSWPSSTQASSSSGDSLAVSGGLYVSRVSSSWKLLCYQGCVRGSEALLYINHLTGFHCSRYVISYLTLCFAIFFDGVLSSASRVNTFGNFQISLETREREWICSNTNLMPFLVEMGVKGGVSNRVPLLRHLKFELLLPDIT